MNVILSICMLVINVFQQGNVGRGENHEHHQKTSKNNDFTCLTSILDESEIIEYNSSKDQENLELAIKKFKENSNFIDKQNFWQAGYTRYLIHMGYHPNTGNAITPEKFCDLIGGIYKVEPDWSYNIKYDSQFPCMVWIAFCGYDFNNYKNNKKIAEKRQQDSFDQFLSKFAQQYADYMLGKFNPEDLISSQSISTKKSKYKPESIPENEEKNNTGSIRKDIQDPKIKLTEKTNNRSSDNKCFKTWCFFLSSRKESEFDKPLDPTPAYFCQLIGHDIQMILNEIDWEKPDPNNDIKKDNDPSLKN